MRILSIVFGALALLVSAVLAAVAEPSRATTATPSPATQSRVWPGPFAVTLVAVQDGDTVTVKFQEGPCGRGPCAGSIWSIRVAGIDTPESRLCKRWRELPGLLDHISPRERTRMQSCAWCPAEVEAVKSLKTYVGKVLARHPIRVEGLRRDPYWGRLVGSIEIDAGGGDWRSLAAALRDTGLVEDYDPAVSGYAKSKPWCEAGR